jgi:spore maturation protein B
MISAYILPIIFLMIFIYARIKKVNTYSSFVKGAKDSLPLILDIFPYIVAIMVMIELMRVSGVTSFLSDVLNPVFSFMGIPKELTELVLLKPFSGSGSLSLLSDIYTTYGVDSYIGRCASVIISSCDTVFYISAIYFAGTNVKKIPWAIPIALLACLAGVMVSCLMCRLL